MANRFAWSWKLAQVKFPVVLIYLGFINAAEMGLGFNSPQEVSFPNHEAWKNLVFTHSKGLFTSTVWDSCWNVHDQSLLAIQPSNHEGLLHEADK